ncbi:MAG TPA: reverse transcriptase domain-containing protein [Chryseolinea sp.]
METFKTRAFELRTARDYPAWRVETYYRLLGHDWYGHVDGSNPRPKESEQNARKEWDREDAKAMAFINSVMAPSFKLQFKAATALKTLWERMEAQFQPKGFNQRYTALLALVQTSLSSCGGDIEKYCSTFTQARDEQIIANGEEHSQNNLTEDNLVTLFIGGLNQAPQFESFVLNFRQKEKMPNLEDTMSLAREEARIHKGGAGSKDNPIVLNTQRDKTSQSTKRKGKKGNCPEHPGMSHNEDDCWTIHPEKRPQKQSSRDKPNNRKPDWKHGAISALTVDALSAISTSTWAIDTGASQHFCNDLSVFEDLTTCEPINIRGATGNYSCCQKGNVHLTWVTRKGGTQLVKLLDVLYIPTLPVNLVAATLLRKRGIYFNNLDDTLRLASNHREIGYAPRTNGLNILSLKGQSETNLSAFPVLADNRPNADLWHQRFSHSGYTLLKTVQHNSTGIGEIVFKDQSPCEACHIAKSQRAVSRQEKERATIPFGRIHVDVVGHITPESSKGERWVTILTDDCTRHRWNRITKSKGEAFDVLKWFVDLVKIQHAPYRVLEFFLDGGLEFGGQRLDQLTQEEGIILKKSSPYTPEQNGAAESSNKVIFTKARTMMIDSGLPNELWPEAVNTAVYTTNRMSTRQNAIPPRAQLIKHLTGQVETTDVSNLRRFGCVAYLHIPAERRLKSAKFNVRAVRGYFVGYQKGGSTNYRIWLPEANMIKESPHVTFIETQPYKSSFKEDRVMAEVAPYLLEDNQEVEEHTIDKSIDLPETFQNHQQSEINKRTYDDDDDTIVVEPRRRQQVVEEPQEDTNEGENPNVSSSQLRDDIDQNQRNSTNPSEDTPTEDIRVEGVQEAQPRPTTRQGASSQRKTYDQYRTLFGPHAQYAYAMATIETKSRTCDPQSYDEAMSSPEADHWQMSMNREVQQLENQGAWAAVWKLPPGRILIKGKWVYKKKLNPDNSIKEYKSRWVAKGFMQQEGIDYFDTYAATLFTTTFRVIFSLAASHGWKLYQMDVIGAFLHGKLKVEIYMEAPKGFYGEKQICKVLKSIYGLKQAPYLWFEALSKALNKLGFFSIKADVCCFMNKEKDVFVLVFVDDLQITGPNTKAIEQLQNGLRNEFNMKDVEPTTYLGLQIEREGNCLRLHQAPYVRKILESFGFDNAKSVPTPMTDRPLCVNEGEVNDALKELYLRAIGSLMFLANRTRPDVEYPVNFLARFCQNPSPEHWNAVKRIFRYLGGTIDRGIKYKVNPSEPFIFGFSDSDYAGDLDTRKSTSGYLFVLGGGPVSWKSQLQRTVTLSSTEAEYAALTEAAREANWLQQLLTELGFSFPALKPMLIYEDNTSTISLATNHSNHKRSKHVDVKNHYCREQQALGNIQVEYIRTEDQAADGFTKPLGPQRWNAFLEQIRLTH